MVRTIVIIGAGNLATNLSLALQKQGYTIAQVFSRTMRSAQELAEKLGVNYTCYMSELFTDADLYIIAISDNAIPQFCVELANVQPVIARDKLIVHTSGSTGMSVFQDVFKNYGILYPFMTFTKQCLVTFDKIPVCIEANTSNNLEIIRQVAGNLSQSVHHLTSQQRQYLHLAAVFACNFVNKMYTTAYQILDQQNLSFDLIKPLMERTLENALNNRPDTVQTGPARRNDTRIIEQHLRLLENNPMQSDIYRTITNHILSYYNSQKATTV